MSDPDFTAPAESADEHGPADPEQLRRRLLARAFLHDDPGAYAAGVDEALAAVIADPRIPTQLAQAAARRRMRSWLDHPSNWSNPRRRPGARSHNDGPM